MSQLRLRVDKNLTILLKNWIQTQGAGTQAYHLNLHLDLTLEWQPVYPQWLTMLHNWFSLANKLQTLSLIISNTFPIPCLVSLFSMSFIFSLPGKEHLGTQCKGRTLQSTLKGRNTVDGWMEVELEKLGKNSIYLVVVGRPTICSE